MKRVVRFALALAALGVLGGVWLVRRYRSTIEVSPYDLAVRSVEDNAAEGARIGAKPVQIGTLRALLRPPRDGSHAWLMYWGGNTSTYFKESVDTVKALELPEEIGVLIVAPPGYDGSEGHPSPENVPVAAREARDWLVQHHHAEKIVTGGFSMGTLSAIAAATQATFLLSAPTLFETGDPSRFIRLKTPVQYRPPRDAPKVDALVLHGEADDGFPIQMGRDVAAWLGGRFVALPGVGHVDLQTNAAAMKEARAFVLAQLSQG
jgi:pimeloyl-ACP methyl ester carboxylesterase